MSDTNFASSASLGRGKSAADGKLTVVAIFHFIFAGLNLFAGGFLLAAFLFLTVLDWPFLFFSAVVGEPDAEAPFASKARIAMISAFVQIGMVVPMVATGVGLLKHRHWAIHFGIVIAIVAGAVALACLALMRVYEAGLLGTYSLTSIVLLFQARRTLARESTNYLPREV